MTVPLAMFVPFVPCIPLALLGGLLAPPPPPTPSPPPQSCPDQGSRLVGNLWEDGPRLGCAYRPDAPAWRLYTPAHREVVPRVGYRQGNAHPLPRLLFRYECTGLWLFPTRLVEIKTLGYVFDVGQRRCRAVPSESPAPRSDPGTPADGTGRT